METTLLALLSIAGFFGIIAYAIFDHQSGRRPRQYEILNRPVREDDLTINRRSRTGTVSRVVWIDGDVARVNSLNGNSNSSSVNEVRTANLVPIRFID